MVTGFTNEQTGSRDEVRILSHLSKRSPPRVILSHGWGPQGPQFEFITQDKCYLCDSQVTFMCMWDNESSPTWCHFTTDRFVLWTCTNWEKKVLSNTCAIKCVSKTYTHDFDYFAAFGADRVFGLRPLAFINPPPPLDVIHSPIIDMLPPSDLFPPPVYVTPPRCTATAAAKYLGLCGSIVLSHEGFTRSPHCTGALCVEMLTGVGKNESCQASCCLLQAPISFCCFVSREFCAKLRNCVSVAHNWVISFLSLMWCTGSWRYPFLSSFAFHMLAELFYINETSLKVLL